MNREYPDRPEWFTPSNRPPCSMCSKDSRAKYEYKFCSKFCFDRHARENNPHTYVRDKGTKPDPTAPLRKIYHCMWCRKETTKGSFCSSECEQVYEERYKTTPNDKRYIDHLSEKGLKPVPVFDE